jgi:hypothetical protein
MAETSAHRQRSNGVDMDASVSENLPMEMVLMIAEAQYSPGIPSHPGAILITVQTLRSLYQLCLVSKIMRVPQV